MFGARFSRFPLSIPRRLSTLRIIAREETREISFSWRGETVSIYRFPSRCNFLWAKTRACAARLETSSLFLARAPMFVCVCVCVWISREKLPPSMKPLVAYLLFVNSQVAIDRIILTAREASRKRASFIQWSKRNCEPRKNNSGKVKSLPVLIAALRDKRWICWKRKCKRKQREPERFMIIGCWKINMNKNE